jgi:hypothetical protein
MTVCLLAVVISCVSPAAETAGEDLVVRFYAVETLVQDHPDSPAPPIGLAKDRRKGKDQAPAGPGKDRMAELIRLVRATVSPGGWKGGASVEADAARLKVTAPESVQREVSELIQALAGKAGRMVAVETRLFSLDEKAMRRLAPEVRKALDRVASLGPEAAGSGKALEDVVVAAVLKEGKMLGGPKVTAFDRQLSHTLVIDQKAYIADVEGEGDLRKPVIGVLNTGTAVEVRPKIAEDGTRATLDLRCVRVEVPEPMKTRIVQGVPVQVPEEIRTEFKVAIDVASGVTCIAAVSLTREGAMLGFIVNARVIVPSASPEGR